MPGHLALIRGNESHIGDYNLIFFVLFLWYELWSLLVSRGRAQMMLIRVTQIATMVPGYDYDGQKDPSGKWF